VRHERRRGSDRANRKTKSAADSASHYGATLGGSPAKGLPRKRLVTSCKPNIYSARPGCNWGPIVIRSLQNAFFLAGALDCRVKGFSRFGLPLKYMFTSVGPSQSCR